MAGMRYQPQGRAIAGSTGLARGLRFAGVPKLLNAPAIPIKTSPSLSRGGALAFTTPGGTSYNLPIASITSSEWTVACLAFSVADNYATAFEIYGSSASRISLMLWGQGGTMECDARPYRSDYGGTRVVVPKNTPVVLGATVSGSANLIRTFIDRTEAGSTPLTSTAPITVNQINLFGKDGGVGDRAQAGNQILLMVVWDRALSTAEWGQFVSNPWQVLDDQADEDELLPAPSGAGATATASWTEQGESVALAGAVSASASAAWTEANETTGAAATVRVIAAASWTESGEASAAAAIATAAASVGWTEGSDTHSASASVGASAAINAAWVEGAETVAAAANVKVSMAMGWGEAGETHAALATARINAAAGWAEQSDMVGVSAQVLASTGSVDVSTISPARMVVFEGSGSRVVTFEGSGSRVVRFE